MRCFCAQEGAALRRRMHTRCRLPAGCTTLLVSVLAAALLTAAGAGAPGTTYCWRTLHGPAEPEDLFPADFPVFDFPTPVSGTNQFVTLGAGVRHMCGIDAAGSAWCFGNGDAGQLGDGQSGQAHTAAAPVRVLGGHTFTAISAGRRHT